MGAKELPKLANAGWTVRIPPPGARREGNIVRVNTAYPELAIECLFDSAWVRFERCQAAGGRLSLRAVTRDGKLSSRATVIETGELDSIVLSD